MKNLSALSAIPTIGPRDILFRSRLEIRWATFFDVMGWQWEYEPERVELAEGPYTPDFKVTPPDGRTYWMEVKPWDPHSYDDLLAFQKLHALAAATRLPAMLLAGPPRPTAYHSACPQAGALTAKCVCEGFHLHEAFFQDYEPFVHVIDDYWRHLLHFSERTGNSYFLFDRRRTKNAFGLRYLKALDASKSIQFGREP